MIRVFGAADRDFRSNGEIVVKPFVARVTKEDNGEFFLELEAGVEYSAFLSANNIIVAPTPNGEQPFRIGNPEKTRDRIIIRADHVFYDSKNYLIQDSNVVSKTCAGALEHLNAATEPTSPFTTGANVDGINSYRCVRTSLHDAVLTVLERWGGHLVRDGFDIRIDETIGADHGVVVRYGKNLREIECLENWENVVTKILPIGNDGVMISDTPSARYITADIQYDVPFTKCIQFTQAIQSEDYKKPDGEIDEEAYHAALRADLIEQATAYLNANKRPQLSYTLSADVDRVFDVGDVIEVVDERLGIDLLTNVTRYEYDCILSRFEVIEFGTIAPELSGLLGDISASTESAITANNGSVKSQIDAAVNSEAIRVNTLLTGGDVTFDGSAVILKGSNNRKIKLDSSGVSFDQGGGYAVKWSMANALSVDSLTVGGQPYSPGGVSAASAKYEGATKSGVQNAWVALPLSGLVSGGSAFSRSGDGIKVNGAGHVVVSARVDFGASMTTGERKVRVSVNGSAVAESTVYSFTGEDSFFGVISPVVIPVSENDVLTLSAYPIDTADEIKTGASLTVLAVI